MNPAVGDEWETFEAICPRLVSQHPGSAHFGTTGRQIGEGRGFCNNQGRAGFAPLAKGRSWETNESTTASWTCALQMGHTGQSTHCRKKSPGVCRHTGPRPHNYQVACRHLYGLRTSWMPASVPFTSPCEPSPRERNSHLRQASSNSSAQHTLKRRLRRSTP